MKSRGRRDGRARRPSSSHRPPSSAEPAAPDATGERADDAVRPAVAGRRSTERTPGSVPGTTPAWASPDPDDGSFAWAARLYVPAALLILLVAAAYRLPELALNPFHHDEGVNGWFTTNLVRNGTYAYDPANYHGPTLYYFALAAEILLGLTTEAMRFVPVFFGLVTVAAVLALRPILGAVPVLTAGALLAVSPGMVYVSRYFIHEMLLVAFSVTLLLSVLLFLRSGKPVWALIAAGSAALIFATKETGIITIAVLGIAAVVSGVYVNLRAGRSAFAPSKPAARTGDMPKRRAKSIWVDGVEYRAAPDAEADRGEPRALAGRAIDADLLAAAGIVFACVYILFFSSFFTNFPDGLVDSLATFMIWTQTGGETQVQPFQQYLVWMAQVDAPILILGAIGGLIAAIRARDRLWVFIGLWAAGVTLAYSLVAYKTPWIAVNMLLPLALLGGHAIRELLAQPRVPRIAAPVVMAGAVALSGYQAYDLNYRHYDDETYPYVFVHTTREIFDLVREIDAAGERLGTGLETGITIVSPDYWPMPWYLRDYTKAGFWGSTMAGETDLLTTDVQPLIVANATQHDEVVQRIGTSHELVGSYTLRPGVELELFVRSDAAAAVAP